MVRKRLDHVIVTRKKTSDWKNEKEGGKKKRMTTQWKRKPEKRERKSFIQNMANPPKRGKKFFR